MSYTIECAYVSHIGNIRTNNEDNFWCMGDYLEQEHISSAIREMNVPQSEMPVFAVFDGMGGEAKGEIASYLAVCELNNCYIESKNQGENINFEQLLLNSCGRMNRAVSDFAKAQRVGTMGTTAALIGFGPEEIYICNVGDSRIYHQYDDSIKTISTDHVASMGGTGKASLTQYIGMEQSGIPIQPSMAKGTYHRDDSFLICSDGLSDMLSRKEIYHTLDADIPITDAVRELLEKALDKGGNDNITIVLCRINKDRTSKFWTKIIG